MDESVFRIYFNKNKQWIEVFFWEVHPTTFFNWGGGRWAYFEPKWENSREGFFGELHLVKSRIREDTVVHEIGHVVWEWFIANNLQFIRKNEERFCSILDELVGKFYKEYRKL